MAKKLRGQLFARLALDYFDHPKIAGLSSEAIVAHLEMLVYARRYLTDGVIPMRVAMRYALPVVDELASNDPDSPSIVRCEDGSLILHGYEDFQETRAEVEGRRRSAKDRAQARWSKDAVSNARSNAVSTAHSNAETETETEINNVGDSPSPVTADAAPRPDVEALCQKLADHIVSNGGKRPNITKRWRDDARLLLDRDGRDHTEAMRVLDWSQASTFWKANILSMPKFREKYDQLRLQAEADQPQQSAPAFDPRNWRL